MSDGAAVIVAATGALLPFDAPCRIDVSSNGGPAILDSGTWAFWDDTHRAPPNAAAGVTVDLNTRSPCAPLIWGAFLRNSVLAYDAGGWRPRRDHHVHGMWHSGVVIRHPIAYSVHWPWGTPAHEFPEYFTLGLNADSGARTSDHLLSFTITGTNASLNLYTASSPGNLVAITGTVAALDGERDGGATPGSLEDTRQQCLAVLAEAMDSLQRSVTENLRRRLADLLNFEEWDTGRSFAFR
jgi:hypothetical protein